MSDIKLVQSSDKWEIYNQGSLELCSESHKLYLDLMIKSLGDISSKPLDILIIGGGDMQIYNYLYNVVNKDSIISLVDPEAGSYQFYEYLYHPGNYSDRVLANANIHKTLFSEAYENIFNNISLKFDVIIVDCSEEIVNETSEIYCETFLKQLKSLSNSETEIHFYIPDAINDSSLKDLIETYFIAEVCDTYIPAWEETVVVVKLKVKPPVMHCHVHADILFNSSVDILNNTKSFSTGTALKYIVAEYCDVRHYVDYPFETGGHSGSLILGESHFNWHTYPENNLMTLDLYHCNYDESLVSLFKDIFNKLPKKDLESFKISIRRFNPLDKHSSDNFSYLNLK